jgi:aspartate dehydrogenase
MHIQDSLPSLGILGTGSIGSSIAGAIAAGRLAYSVTHLLDHDLDRAHAVAESCGAPARVATLDEMCAECDVIVECAHPSAVAPLIENARRLATGRTRQQHIVVLSVGGLLDLDFVNRPAGEPVVHVPSGALGGLDAVLGMKQAGLEHVELTSRKPPAGLGMDVTVETVVFEGTAAQVIKLFPKNTNVAVALSLAGIGPERTMMRLIADPAIDRNIHHLIARGAAGEVEFISRNLPFPENPKTSYLAALSAIALLGNLNSSLRIG